MDMTEEQLLTVEQVARMLQLKPPTIYGAVRQGRLPVVRLWRGKRRSAIRFRRTDIEAFIEERTELSSLLGDKREAR